MFGAHNGGTESKRADFEAPIRWWKCERPTCLSCRHRAFPECYFKASVMLWKAGTVSWGHTETARSRTVNFCILYLIQGWRITSGAEENNLAPSCMDKSGSAGLEGSTGRCRWANRTNITCLPWCKLLGNRRLQHPWDPVLSWGSLDFQFTFPTLSHDPSSSSAEQITTANLKSAETTFYIPIVA